MPVGRGAKEYLVTRVIRREHEAEFGRALMPQSAYYYMPADQLEAFRQDRIEAAEKAFQRSINGPDRLAIAGRLLKTKAKIRQPGPTSKKKGPKPTSKKKGAKPKKKGAKK